MDLRSMVMALDWLRFDDIISTEVDCAAVQ